MHRLQSGTDRGRGQLIVLFALVLTALLLVVGLVVDGGNALLQRRQAQNAADFAALAGARIVAQHVAGDSDNGTDANVRSAIEHSMAVNRGSEITFGAPEGPRYVDSAGSPVGYVGDGAIPAGSVGVTVAADRTWTPYFVGLVGISEWQASAAATAKGGFAPGGPPGPVFPAGIAEAFFDGRQPCGGDITDTDGDPCKPAHLTPGTLNVPGGFGWLKFGCAGYGLGQGEDGGCANSKPFLQDEIGPPANSYGCCTEVGLPGSLDRIGSLPGNKASADCTYYIENEVIVTVPVWDTAHDGGSGGWYHIVGFTGFQITACNGGKDIEGVWRVPFYTGPTTTTPGFAGAPLSVQLVH